MIFNGLEVVIAPFMKSDEWEQSRTHKCKRINKKWRKRYGLRQKDDMNTTFIMEIKYLCREGFTTKCLRRQEKEQKYEEQLHMVWRQEGLKDES